MPNKIPGYITPKSERVDLTKEKILESIKKVENSNKETFKKFRYDSKALSFRAGRNAD